MKRVCAILAALSAVLTLSACGAEEEQGENTVQIYYISNSETRVEAHSHVMESTDTEEKVDELIQCLSTNPEKLEYKAPLLMGFQVLSVTWDGEKVLLDVDASYLELPTATEVLTRAAVVRTLTQLDKVNYVGITVEGNQLSDSLGNVVGWMNADQFIDNNGNEINTYEQVRVMLYFTGEDGTGLIAAYREKYYSTNVPLERFVVDELIAGPSGHVEGLYPTINPATKVISVMTKDGVCYVNMDESFLTVVNNVSTDVSVYSIVNSLVELNTINKVQILINGEVPAGFQSNTFERNLDMVTTLEN
ncbi:MAG: GerMN domain-containing protein [Butyrivibrio sp.]|nr:GerMN domain-containing protein [Acetatifactor muris]MCM1560767.1 GerMN domain-containing protein [Butyrivibrio sp.]